MTCAAPKATDSMEACFGIVLGKLDVDFGDFGAVRAGDISVLTAVVNTEGTIRSNLRLKPLSLMSTADLEYWLHNEWAGGP